jgi:GlpG protein
MRLLASITGKAKAESLVAHLLTLQISTHVESGKTSEDWDVWIREENRLSEAKQELQTFLDDPTNPRYTEAVRSAHQIIQLKKKQQQDSARQVRTGRQVFRGSPLGTGPVPPVTLTLLIISAVVTIATQFSNPSPTNRFGKTVFEELSFVSQADYVKSGRDPAASLKKGELWRLITPMFPHGGTFHLLFNFMAMIQLGKIVERMEGSSRFAMLVLATAIIAALFQGLMPIQLFGNPFFVGLSGVVYGVFGYLLVKSNRLPHLGIRISDLSVAIMLGWLILGFANLIPGMANMAHLGGFVAGIVIAYFAYLNQN